MTLNGIELHRISLNFNNCSQNVTSDLADQVVEGHAADVIEMRDKVEEMHSSCNSKRIRRTTATKTAPGHSFYGDNVGQ